MDILSVIYGMERRLFLPSALTDLRQTQLSIQPEPVAFHAG